jgi:HAD superfamily hydrolase (TIGR01509 family)
VKLTDTEVRESCGITDADIVARVNRTYGKSINYDEFKQRKFELYRRKVEHEGIKLFPYVREILTLLKEREIPYALASSGSRRKIEYNLAQTGLGNDFAVIVSCEDVKRGKPDPEIFFAAARSLGKKSGDCIVIEDSPNGVKAARAAGMRCIAVTNTFRAEDLGEADFRVGDLSAAWGILQRIIEGTL